MKRILSTVSLGIAHPTEAKWMNFIMVENY
jgi:hypothetical protein